MKIKTLFDALLIAHTNWYLALAEKDFKKTRKYSNTIDKLNIKLTVKINKLEE